MSLVHTLILTHSLYLSIYLSLSFHATTHSLIHTLTHTLTFVHTLPRSLSYTLFLTRPLTLSLLRTHTHTHAHTHTHTHTHTQTHTHTHSLSHTHKHKHTHTHTHTGLLASDEDFAGPPLPRGLLSTCPRSSKGFNPHLWGICCSQSFSTISNQIYEKLFLRSHLKILFIVMKRTIKHQEKNTRSHLHVYIYIYIYIIQSLAHMNTVVCIHEYSNWYIYFYWNHMDVHRDTKMYPW